MTSVAAVLAAREGNARQAQERIRQAKAEAKGFIHSHHTWYTIGTAYARLHEPNKALRWLEKAANEGFPCYPTYAGDPYLKTLRTDPRSISLLARLKKDWAHYRTL